MGRFLGIILAFCLLFLSCTQTEKKRFSKVDPSHSGIRFNNTLTDTPELNILTYLYYYNGGGVAAADVNSDGLPDLYFTSNQGPDKLYLNLGGLQFRDITEEAGIDNNGNWTTGVSHVDINNDGLLDLYVCRIGNYRGIEGKNKLYVNQGQKNGLPVFKEMAASYGLDFSGFSTQAAFLDYDLDGDLDMYLLNHSVHPNSNYGKGAVRKDFDPLSGDRFFENQDGSFVDISDKAGIFQGRIGYGLGIGVSDLNGDLYPDIYVGNDFFENDYLYINQGDGSFIEVISGDNNPLGHTSHYSMGNDLADVNNDGLTDIISLDMLPENLETYKTSGLEFPYPTYSYYLKNGYSPQYMQNTLHLNLDEGKFSEVAHMAGISASEWSWGALIADYDNDGYKDVFISNGIKGATNDMDFINFIANENIQKRISMGMSAEDMEFIDELPVKKVPNYFFRNSGDLSFEDVTDLWFEREDSFSNGCIYADLDLDGDLDVVVNNIDAEAHILENTTNSDPGTNYLSVKFDGSPNNRFGIGARILAYNNSSVYSYENYSTRGYLSAIEPKVHIGLGKQDSLDSLRVIWPGGKTQILKDVPAQGELVLDESNAGSHFNVLSWKTEEKHLEKISDSIPYSHEDPPTLEFDRDPLVPFASTNEGPDISVADVNGDGLDDLFMSGAKNQPSKLLLQVKGGGFEASQEELFEIDARSEDVAHVFFNSNGDEYPDLLVVSGGNEYQSGAALRPRLYINNKGMFHKDSIQFSGTELNASSVVASDIDSDGDMDITISSDLVPWEYGETPRQFIFQNNGSGQFTEVTDTTSAEFGNLGNTKDILWVDLDGNGWKDLVAVGHWMPISVFMNDGETLTLQGNNGLDNSHGWWNTVFADDFDNDGDLDLVCGNWGENSKFKATSEEPITLYRQDFDNNGSVETLVTYRYKGKETPFASKDELVKQMPFLNKKFLSYKAFAAASIDELFGEESLSAAKTKNVYTLQSVYIENQGNGQYSMSPLPAIAQSSSIRDIEITDYNKDGFKDLILVGNNFEISTQLGRMDALHGVILRNEKNGGFKWAQNQGINIQGAARAIEKIAIEDEAYFIIGLNNDSPVLLKKSNH